jgi:hypothetical protein
MGWITKEFGINSWQEQEIFLFSRMHRLQCKPDLPPLSSVKVKNMPSWHGAQLSTGATFVFIYNAEVCCKKQLIESV